jgi:hypothetical protein
MMIKQYTKTLLMQILEDNPVFPGYLFIYEKK